MMEVPEGQQGGTPIFHSQKNPLEGLGACFEETKMIRKFAISENALLKWLGPDKVGVVTNQSLKLNAKVLEVVLRFWCPNAPDRKTVPVGWLKLEAMGIEMVTINVKHEHYTFSTCWYYLVVLCSPGHQNTLQIIKFKQALHFPENVSQNHCETHAIKSFVSRLIRMHDGSKKREPFLICNETFSRPTPTTPEVPRSLVR